MSVEYNGKKYLLPLECETDGTICKFIEQAESILEQHDEYKQISSDNKFRMIHVYISYSNPHYQANIIYNYLYNGNGENFIRWVNRRFKKNPNAISKYLKYENILIKTNDGRSLKKDNIILLTELGLMRAFGSESSNFAVLFQELILNFLRNVRKNYSDIWRKCLEEERTKRIELDIINKQNIQLQEIFNNPADMGDQDKTELIILRRTMMKQYYLYIIDWEYINNKLWNRKTKSTNNKIKKKKSSNLGKQKRESSDEDDNKNTQIKKKIIPHPDGIQERYDLYIKLHDLESDISEYYFTIKQKEITSKYKDKYVFIRHLDIRNASHYKNMVHILKHGNTYNTKTSYPISSEEKCDISQNYDNFIFPNIFQKTYSEIVDARNTSFIHMNKNMLINNNNQ